MTTTTLVTLPLLTFVSIPLAITASITVFFSAIALYLQLLYISFELCYALLTNLFTIPLSPNWSLLSFTVSQPSSPDRRRSSDYGFFQSPFSFRPQGPLPPPPAPPSLGPRTGSSNPLDMQDINPFQNPFYSPDTRRPNLQQDKRRSSSSTSGFLALVSGQEDRDFEGLGGWRCPPSTTKSPGRTTPPPSSNSADNEIKDEIDDLAWVSLNSRLELPSQPLAIRRSSNPTTTATTTHIDAGTAEQLYLPWRRTSQVAVSGTKMNKGNDNHHRRSATTSMVSGFGVRSPTSQVLSRHDPPSGQTQSQSYSKGATRSLSHTSLYENWNRYVGSVAGAGGSGGGYFALQPKSAWSNSGARTTSNTTPSEDRKPAKVQVQVAAGNNTNVGASGGTHLQHGRRASGNDKR
ncbi:hypothetical protein BJX61DRAFT_94881 [Aspergillus egyptiacus]|nr:hypothetical protein BJX61DRAFT_94881 [Aspergillus egyptiacus]